MTSSKRFTVSQIQFIAWVASAICALVLCVSVIVGISVSRHNSNIENLLSRFEEKSTQAFRRIEAELSVNNASAVPALADMFESDLGIDRIQIISSWPSECGDLSVCSRASSGFAHRYARFDTRYGDYVLSASIATPSLWSDLELGSLWWVVLAIFALSFAGVLIQRAITKKYIVNPISRLVERTTSEEGIPAYYPQEIEQLATELSKSLDARDKVIFGQLASGVIHDLRTQIQSMISAVSLIEEIEDQSPKRKQRLDHLYQAAHRNLPRMLKVIESTLDGSRDISIHPSDKDIHETLLNSVRSCESLAKDRNVKVELDTTEAPRVHHDGTQVERVFSNLIKNAIEAFDSDENTQSFKTVRLSTRTLGDTVEISIEDSGPGVALAPRELFKLSKTTKPNGYGLGLMISKRIIEAHNGSIESGRSENLKGAKFTVRIPLGAQS